MQPLVAVVSDANSHFSNGHRCFTMCLPCNPVSTDPAVSCPTLRLIFQHLLPDQAVQSFLAVFYERHQKGLIDHHRVRQVMYVGLEAIMQLFILIVWASHMDEGRILLH